MDRQWLIDAPSPLSVEDDGELAGAIEEASMILNRLGGAIIMVAQREEVAPDIWNTTGFLFKWSSYAPGKRREPAPEPDAEPAVSE